MSVRRNVIANYAGQGWVALMQFAFVPLYIHFLGVEAFGLIGVFTMLQAWMTLLDMGMTPTVNREMARFTAGAHTPASIRDLLRTVECLAFLIALGIIFLTWVSSNWLASDWLRANTLSVVTVSEAISLMGGVVALRFIEGIYRGALLGLQKQVFFNVANALIATLRAGGAVALLAWWAPTIEVFFIWQAFVSLLSVGLLALFTQRSLPVAARRARFSTQAVLDVRSFAGGMMATTFLALLLTQVDKILLSRLLSLEMFGYYTLAATVASALTLLVVPVTQAVYPRFTELVATESTAELTTLYHRSARTVTVFCAPAAMILLMLPETLLNVWTHDARLSAEVAPLLSLLSLGTFLNSLMHIPYMLQLAYGWASFAAKVNIVAVIVLTPAILWAVPRYGAEGAAWAWVVLNASYIFIAQQFMHRRLLPTEKWAWYVKDIFVPLASAALAVFGVEKIMSSETVYLPDLVWLALGGSAGYALAFAATYPKIKLLH